MKKRRKAPTMTPQAGHEQSARSVETPGGWRAVAETYQCPTWRLWRGRTSVGGRTRRRSGRGASAGAAWEEAVVLVARRQGGARRRGVS